MSSDHCSIFSPGNFIYMILLNCDYKKLRDYAQGTSNEIVTSNVNLLHTAWKYKSIEQYYSIYSNLLYVETIDQISQMCGTNEAEWFEAELGTQRKIGRPEISESVLYTANILNYPVTGKNFNEDQFPLPKSVICINFRENISFAYVLKVSFSPKLPYHYYEGDPDEIISWQKLSILMVKEISYGTRPMTSVEVKFISNLNSTYKMYQSLLLLKNSPFFAMLLTPNLGYVGEPIIKPLNKQDLYLNEQQQDAIIQISEVVLNNPEKTLVRMIHGPPGTGKTQTVTALVANINRNFKRGPILICSQTNASIDELILRIVGQEKVGNPINIIRLGNIKKIHPDVQKYSVHDHPKKDLQAADIIASTLSSSYGWRTEKLSFSCCIIDEAAQCHEPETLIPFLLNFTKLILVGDHKQLPPTVISNRAKHMGLTLSMFERFYKMLCNHTHTGIYPLTIQYRMHESIAFWPSKYFYNGSLVTPPSITQLRTCNSSPYRIFNLQNSIETKNEFDKVINEIEADFIRKFLSKLIRSGRSKSIGVITPYKAQRRLLENKLEFLQSQKNDIDVNTLNTFQGKERDVIICSFVRANDRGNIGFLLNKCLLNVALTRAKQCCYIVANLATFSNSFHIHWAKFIEDARKRNVITDIL